MQLFGQSCHRIVTPNSCAAEFCCLPPSSCYRCRMLGSNREPSRGAARRLQQEKRRAVLYSTVGAVLLVAAVAGLLVAIYMRQAR